MNINKTIKKGAEPAVTIPVLTYAIQMIGESLDVSVTPAGAASIAGFLYGVYRSVINYWKHRNDK